MLTYSGGEAYRIYWRLYGGWGEAVKSAYFHASCVFTILAYPFWTQVDATGSRPWAQVSIEVIPSLMGFTMGGMAIVLAFSSTDIFKHLSQRGKPDSFFAKLVGNFFHFICIQTIAIAFAVLSKAYDSHLLSGIGFLAFSYAIAVALATGAQLLLTSQIFNAAASESEQKGEGNGKIRSVAPRDGD